MRPLCAAPLTPQRCTPPSRGGVSAAVEEVKLDLRTQVCIHGMDIRSRHVSGRLVVTQVSPCSACPATCLLSPPVAWVPPLHPPVVPGTRSHPARGVGAAIRTGLLGCWSSSTGRAPGLTERIRPPGLLCIPPGTRPCHSHSFCFF